jgi:Na+/alanine symporter
MVLTLAFPNITGLLILAPEVAADMKDYVRRYRTGLIERHK